MAFSAFLTKASCETEYQRPSFSADESVFEPKIVAEEPESKDNKFEEILALKQKANEIRVQIEELRLKQAWQDNINHCETIEDLEAIDTQLKDQRGILRTFLQPKPLAKIRTLFTLGDAHALLLLRERIISVQLRLLLFCL